MEVGDTYFYADTIVKIDKVTSSRIRCTTPTGGMTIQKQTFNSDACPITKVNSIKVGDIVNRGHNRQYYTVLEVTNSKCHLRRLHDKTLWSINIKNIEEIWRKKYPFIPGMLILTREKPEYKFCLIISVDYSSKRLIGPTSNIPFTSAHYNMLFIPTNNGAVGDLLMRYNELFVITGVNEASGNLTILNPKTKHTEIISQSMDYTIYRRFDMEEMYTNDKVFNVAGKSFAIESVNDDNTLKLRGFSRYMTYDNDYEIQHGLPVAFKKYRVIQTQYGLDIVDGKQKFEDYIANKYMITIPDFLIIINTPEKIFVNFDNKRTLQLATAGWQIRPEHATKDLITCLNEFIASN